ncbi:hypothetical protein GCM10022224_103810 [Nonomuraea antimicrobica]|uniref:PH domain-containing protein n=1 Tax=Nonomuraea antimicrobica TaxID=561173 RepID=A0ABP7EPN4_9ACTN
MTEQPEWMQALNRAAADVQKAFANVGGVLAAQGAMGWAYRGDVAAMQFVLAGMPPEQLRALSAAASMLTAAADEELSSRRAAQGGAAREEAPVEDWERGPDAASGIGVPPARVEGRVLALFGDAAVVVTALHSQDDPLRVSAAELAEQLGIAVEDLPGRRFVGGIVDDRVVNAELVR